MNNKPFLGTLFVDRAAATHKHVYMVAGYHNQGGVEYIKADVYDGEALLQREELVQSLAQFFDGTKLPMEAFIPAENVVVITWDNIQELREKQPEKVEWQQIGHTTRIEKMDAENLTKIESQELNLEIQGQVKFT